MGRKKKGKNKRSLLELERGQIVCISCPSADSIYANLIPSFIFGQVAKANIVFLLCETYAEMVPVPFVCLLVGLYRSSAGFWDIENSSQHRLLL